MSNIKDLSVFFPCVNEEGNLENTVKNAVEVLNRLKLNYEIIIINDGSTDNTQKLAEKLQKEYKNIRIITHHKNLGYGESLKSGFYNAKYDTIVYTDGDGQFDFNEVTKFLDKIEDNDLVIGFRIKRQDPIHRILFAKGWGLSLFTFFGLRLKDVDCGFKMVKRRVLEKIPKLESQRGAMINAELAIKTKKYGFRLAQVGVNHYPRKMGKPTGANIMVIFKSFSDLIRLWWKLKDQKIHFILLIGILLLAAFLRFYRLEDYMNFLGDEGRDALVINDLLVNKHFPFIGPTTSVGNMYLGPLFYYMMALPMSIFWLNPVAASGMVAAIGVLIVGLIYYLSKIWFGRTAALIASFLYAISPVTIIYSRSSWNPNPAPFFALIAIFSLYKLNKSGNFNWLILTGISVAAASQMHYLALVLIPIAGILYLVEIFLRSSQKLPLKNFWVGSMSGIFSFILVMSPLIIFDIRHNYLNYRALITLLSEDSNVKGDLISNILRAINIYSNNLVGRYMAGGNNFLTGTVSIILLLPFVKLVQEKIKANKINWPILALYVWLFVGVIGVSFYQNNIYDHYLGFLSPVPFLLLGATETLFRNSRNKILHKGWVLAIIFLTLTLTIVNFQKNPLLNEPNKQWERTQKISRQVIKVADSKSYNFALLSKNNYDAAYQFYLDQFGFKPQNVASEVTDQLIVVCEDPVCLPVGHAKYEIAAFGWVKIESEQDYEGVKIYKLIANPSGQP